MSRNGFEIDSRFLEPVHQREFDSDWVLKVRSWYEPALDCFKRKGEMHYIPRIYVTPFYAYDESPVSVSTKEGRKTGKMIIRQVATTTVDVDDPDKKWAIYVLFDLIKRAAPELVTATLAHEILHCWHRQIEPKRLTPGKIYSILGKSAVQAYYIKEREVKNAEDFFEEPVRTMILVMEKEKSQLGAGKKYTEGAEGIPGPDLLSRLLGPERAKDFLTRILGESL